MSDYDPVKKPEHYTNTKVECIDAMIVLAFIIGLFVGAPLGAAIIVLLIASRDD